MLERLKCQPKLAYKIHEFVQTSGLKKDTHATAGRGRESERERKREGETEREGGVGEAKDKPTSAVETGICNQNLNSMNARRARTRTHCLIVADAAAAAVGRMKYFHDEIYLGFIVLSVHIHWVK